MLMCLTGNSSSIKWVFVLKYNDQGQICDFVAYGDLLLFQGLIDGKA